MRDLFGTNQLEPREILYQGKIAYELTRAELIECAMYLKNAHVALVKRIDQMNRLIDRLKEACSENDLIWIDRWLTEYPISNGELYNLENRPPDWQSSKWRDDYLRKK